MLEQFGLTKVRKNNAARLSGGEKRRLEIARCLVCEPLLILLDEPFTGIDPITIADIRTIIQDLRNQGIGILLTDHNVREVLKITDRSYLIKDGKVRTHGTPQRDRPRPDRHQRVPGQGLQRQQLRRRRSRPPPAPPTLNFPPRTASERESARIHRGPEDRRTTCAPPRSW